jgi:tetratricopeptide (TPR) repeat protein
MTRGYRYVIYMAACVGLLSLTARAATSQVQMDKSQQLALLEQANQAFEQALDSTDAQRVQGYYQQTIEAYEQLVAAGIHNAKLYYNLGNAYFLRHDLGHAILNYRRGLRLEPGNRRLQANLRYVRSQRTDLIDASAQQALGARLLFWSDDLSLQTQLTLALVAFLLIWAGAFAHLFWRRPAFIGLSASTAFIFVLLLASILMRHAQNTRTQNGVIVSSEAPIRKGNGASYALQFPHPLHNGTEFVVREHRGSWLHIQLANGASGWIRQAYAALW